ncbi:hypothetical protein [Micavibrio aeruginosavorus]|uniref:Uncharacterized protein n=1 Tax=Micavibrio aeruginosavorus (strain ARL-13) TaxID=856793 RepID=G2KMZ8_MICAA|nr:hypothetical protein [Micavibrio aeruginosavorus]AEP08930.1 hypothetical protein MICA_593 [Micavibrio aeruginosavorus ARL-13]
MFEQDKAMLAEKLEEIFEQIPCNDFYETGSKFICNPPVLDTDEDYVFDCSEVGQADAAGEFLSGYGFYVLDMADDEYDDIRENFTSYRLGDLNFIICNNKLFYKKFVLATQLSAELNLLKKEDRILLFQAILYGKIHGEEV